MSNPAEDGRGPASMNAPAGLAWCSLGLGLVGLMVSAYLAYEHFSGSTTLACPDTGRINCLKVTSSQYAGLAGVPVALLGTLYFAALLPLLVPVAWRHPERWVRLTRLAMAALGVVMVLYLIWAEFYAIGALCLWCTAVHVVTFLLFATLLFAEAVRDDPLPWSPSGTRCAPTSDLSHDGG